MRPGEDATPGGGGVQPGSRPVVVQLQAPLATAAACRLCLRVHDLLLADRSRGVVCDVRGVPDLSVVDAVARIALTARRLHAPVRVHGAGPELAALLALAGLRGVVPELSEPVGEPEPGEQRGVQEVVDVHDLPG